MKDFEKEGVIRLLNRDFLQFFNPLPLSQTPS